MEPQQKHNHSNVLVEVLKVKAFRYLWLAQVISQITVNMLVFVLGVLIYAQTNSNTAVSILYLTVGVPAALFGIFSGALVDRFNKKTLLIFTTLIRALFICLLLWTRTNLFTIFLLSASISIASQFFVPAEAALIPNLVGNELLLPANSLFTLTFYSAIIGGFVAGGPLLDLLGWQVLLIVLTALFLVAALLLILMPGETESKKLSHGFTFTELTRDVAVGLRFIYQSIKVRNAILLLLLSQAVIAIFATLGPGFADKILFIKLTDASILILGPAALGMIIGALGLSQLRTHFSKRKLINTSILLSGFLLIFVAQLAYSPKYTFARVLHPWILPLVVGSFFLLGLVNSLIDVTCNTILQENTTEEVRGRVYGVLSSLIGGVAIIPVIISGIFADLYGVATIVLLIGLILVALGIFTSFSSKLIRK